MSAVVRTGTPRPRYQGWRATHLPVAYPSVWRTLGWKLVHSGGGLHRKEQLVREDIEHYEQQAMMSLHGEMGSGRATVAATLALAAAMERFAAATERVADALEARSAAEGQASLDDIGVTPDVD